MKQMFLAVILMCLGTMSWAQNGYQIRSGDVLAVEVLEDPTLNREVLVLPDGSFNFPFAGTLRVRGLTVAQVEEAMTRALAPNFATEPNVFVTVRQIQTSVTGPATGPTIDVYFLGEVNTPGLVEVPPGTTFLQAISRAGGFTNFAAQRRIQLRRTDPVSGQQSVSEIDFRSISNGAVMAGDIVLADGDVILAPERRLFE
ncbi:MAG: polysaccharide biosynthesis/export family protein [Pseudomonadota bacterium]